MNMFDENGKELRPERVCMNEEGFQEYIDKFGLERAQGYRDAFHALYYDLESREPYPFSINRMSTQAKKFIDRNAIVLQRIEQILENNQTNKELPTPLKYTP